MNDICYPLRVSNAQCTDGTCKAPNHIPVATAGFVEGKCIAPPASVNVDDVIDIRIVYKWCSVEKYDPHNLLETYPFYDGAELWYLNWPKTKRFTYIWRLASLDLYYEGERVQSNGRAISNIGDEFSWNFHGTAEQLLGEEITEPTDITLNWAIGYQIYGWVGEEWFPWGAPLDVNFLDSYESNTATISCAFHVDVPPPEPPAPDYPVPVFNRNLCSLSKTTIAPDENFNIKVTIENQNETQGSYFLGYYSEGNYYDLASGTISGYGTKSHTFTTTANDLADKNITENQMLSFKVAVSNDEKETSTWTPAALYVIVGKEPEPEPPEPEPPVPPGPEPEMPSWLLPAGIATAVAGIVLFIKGMKK